MDLLKGLTIHVTYLWTASVLAFTNLYFTSDLGAYLLCIACVGASSLWAYKNPTTTNTKDSSKTAVLEEQLKVLKSEVGKLQLRLGFKTPTGRAI